MKLLKNKLRRTITRYKDFNEFQKTLMEEAARMEKRLRVKGIAVVAIPILASGPGQARGDDKTEVFISCPVLTDFRHISNDTMLLLRQLCRNFSADSGEALMKEMKSWNERSFSIKIMGEFRLSL